MSRTVEEYYTLRNKDGTEYPRLRQYPMSMWPNTVEGYKEAMKTLASDSVYRSGAPYRIVKVTVIEEVVEVGPPPKED